MYSYGPPHMAEQKQDDQLEHTYSSYVRIQDVAPKTCLGRWTLGRSGERGSGISVLAAWHDDDDDDICLIAMMLTSDNWFHAVFIRQSSENEKDRKRKILEKSEKWKIKIMFSLELRITLCVCVCMCVCVLYLRIVVCGRISDCLYV